MYKGLETSDMLSQTPWKLSGFYQTEDGFWPDFVDLKYDYTQEFYKSYSFYISKCLRTGKFGGVWNLSPNLCCF